MGVVIALCALVYFLLSVYVIMPYYGGGLLRIDRYAQLGNSLSDVITNSIRHPRILLSTLLAREKLWYLVWLFLPVAFTPLFSGRALVLLVPGLAQNLLANFASQYSNLYHYDSVLVGQIWITAVYGFAFLLRQKPRIAKVAPYVFACALLGGYVLRSPVNPIHFPVHFFTSTPRSEAYREITELIPHGVSVAAHTNLVPHLAHRTHIAMLGQERFTPDVVVIDGGDFFGFADGNALQKYFNSYAQSGRYKVTSLRDRYFILTRRDIGTAHGI